jgi:hypothetical protein
MNYNKIYDDFIESRKFRPKLNSEYYERHHIHPVSLGGRDDDENLIYLTYEEHYFAHLLLAKTYGGPMWRAIIAMQMPQNGRVIRNRHMFAVARRNLAIYVSDQTEYEFEDLRTGKVFTATREYLQKEYGLDFSQTSKLVRGISASARGICLAGNAENAGKHKKYNIVSLEDGLTHTGTAKELSEKLGISEASIYSLTRRIKLVAGKYYLEGTDPTKKTKAVDEFTLVHIESGAVITGTRPELMRLTGMHNSSVSHITNGKSLTSFGYCLPENYERVLAEKFKPIRLINAEGETITGTKKEIRKN